MTPHRKSTRNWLFKNNILKILKHLVFRKLCGTAFLLIFRWIAENGEMNYEIKSGIPDHISSCFSLYINFNRSMKPNICDSFKA